MNTKVIYSIKTCSYKKGKVVEEVLFEDNDLNKIVKDYEDFICGRVLSINTLKSILDTIGYYCFDSNTIITKN